MAGLGGKGLNLSQEYQQKLKVDHVVCCCDVSMEIDRDATFQHI